jgi:hypothetical protein
MHRTSVSRQSSELVPQPLPHKRVCPPPRTQVERGGTHSLAGEGVGPNPIQATGQKLWYSLYYNPFTILAYTHLPGLGGASGLK